MGSGQNAGQHEKLEPQERLVLALAGVPTRNAQGPAAPAELDVYLRRNVDPWATDVNTLTEDLWTGFQDGVDLAGERATVAAIWMLEQEVRHVRKHGLHLMRGLSGSGWPHAQYQFGLELLKGGVVDRDLKGAKALFEQVCSDQKTAPQVRAKALVTLGDMLRDGRGCVRDQARALSLYEQAALLKDGTGAHRAGLFHHGLVDGWNGQRDLNLAAHYYEIAADRGEVKAQTALGLLHGSGQLKKSDSSYGLKLLQRAMEGGEGVATAVLATMQRGVRTTGAASREKSHGSLA